MKMIDVVSPSGQQNAKRYNVHTYLKLLDLSIGVFGLSTHVGGAHRYFPLFISTPALTTLLTRLVCTMPNFVCLSVIAQQHDTMCMRERSYINPYPSVFVTSCPPDLYWSMSAC